MEKKPNILYILTDQQYAGAMSCAGNPELHTPAMDSIAENGVRFDRAYCTYPLCTPSRASMFAGRMPHEIGVNENGLPIDEEYQQQGLGHLLTSAGYECAYGGKWHVPEIAIPEHHGFRRICGFDDVALPHRCNEFLLQKRDTPFFLVASFDNPHNICEWRRGQTLPWGPVSVPPSLEDCPMLPPNVAVPPFEPEIIRLAVRNSPRVYAQPEYTEEQWRRYRWVYYRLVEKVDKAIGQILDTLRAAGLDDNTLIILSSDHGDHHGAHHLNQKSVMYEEAMRVPFLFSVKGLPKPGNLDNTHLVSNGLDLFATICDFAGVELPDGMEGRSLRPLLDREEPVDWRDHLVGETRFSDIDCDGRMALTARYKYIAYSWGSYREQLFDLENDPGEMVNLAVSARHKDILAQHRQLLRAWCERTQDTFSGGHYSHRNVPFMVPGDEYTQSEEG